MVVIENIHFITKIKKAILIAQKRTTVSAEVDVLNSVA